MPGLDSVALLDLADATPHRSIERGLAVLEAAGAGNGTDWRDRPLGTVAGELLRLRRATLGTEAEGVVACPRCGESMELRLPVEGLIDRPAATTVDVDFDGFAVRARALTASDLDAAATAGSLRQVRAALVAASVVQVERGNRPVASDELPPSVVVAVAAAVEEVDPLADPVLDVTCPSCSDPVEIAFDVATFVWTELVRRSRHALVEVDALARRYGWTEAEILALPEARRRRYLELGG